MLDVEFVERSFSGEEFLLQYDLVAFFPPVAMCNLRTYNQPVGRSGEILGKIFLVVSSGNDKIRIPHQGLIAFLSGIFLTR